MNQFRGSCTLVCRTIYLQMQRGSAIFYSSFQGPSSVEPASGQFTTRWTAFTDELEAPTDRIEDAIKLEVCFGEWPRGQNAEMRPWLFGLDWSDMRSMMEFVGVFICQRVIDTCIYKADMCKFLFYQLSGTKSRKWCC
jgi:hypothetical protein